MSNSVLAAETSLVRNVLFALELIDAVTLERVNSGVEVEARGLKGDPISNAGGLFVWLKEDLTALKTIAIDTGDLPYQSIEIDRSQIQPPVTTGQLTTFHLAPRVNYPFQAGTTGLRGTLIESRTGTPQPVLDAEIHLRWLDIHGAWQDGVPLTRTAVDKGEFVAILRLLPLDSPDFGVPPNQGALSVKLRATRPLGPARDSTLLMLTPGRLLAPITFAWDELQ
jgi:hypothetical protein